MNPSEEKNAELNQENKTPESKKDAIKTEIIDWIKTIVGCFLVVGFLYTFVLINASIPSGSMENTMAAGDRLFASRLNYTFGDPQRGDICIFNYPVDKAQGKKRLFIKRVIGLPGETVEIKDAKVYINGSDTPLDEPYLKEEWKVRNDGMFFEVPEGYYFVMGDNRNNSSDGRYWAEKAMAAGVATTVEEAINFSFVPEKDMLGKAYLRYWPLNKISIVK